MAELIDRMAAGGVDVIAFTSSAASRAIVRSGKGDAAGKDVTNGPGERQQLPPWVRLSPRICSAAGSRSRSRRTAAIS